MPCDHTRKDNFICPLCGANLDLHQDEIDSRDKFYPILAELVKKNAPELKFDRMAFDHFMNRNGARMATMMIDIFAKDKNLKVNSNENTSKNIYPMVELEKEKLKVLKAIEKNLRKK